MATLVERTIANLAIGIDSEESDLESDNGQAGESEMRARRRKSLSLDHEGVPRAFRGTPRPGEESEGEQDDGDGGPQETEEERLEREASARRAAHIKRLEDQKLMRELARCAIRPRRQP